MMIVTITRHDLRDEFAMADEAFALSPISARAALPSEADYDAIREAFMETSRGRWFLNEYAKRNRNADTTMVLDAVARIEQALAAQKQAAPDDRLATALTAIRARLEEARTSVTAAFDKQSTDDALAPIHKGVRIIREISWRWREIGGDGRICDLIDSQTDAIDRAHAQLAARTDAADLQAAFDLIANRIDEFSDNDDASSSTLRQEETPPSASTSTEEAPTITETTETEAAVAGMAAVERELAAGLGEKNAASAMEAPASESIKKFAPTDSSDEAHDEALLDMIALEMGAADFDEPEADEPKITEINASGTAGAGPEIAEQETIAPTAKNMTATAPTAKAQTIDAPADEASIVPELEGQSDTATQPSLGASLIASGIVRPQRNTGSDPLAPIRRMTPAERIAFFS
jgi:hypothetical protein